MLDPGLKGTSQNPDKKIDFVFANEQQQEVELICCAVILAVKKHCFCRTGMDRLSGKEERAHLMCWYNPHTDFEGKAPELPIRTYFSTLRLKGSEQVTWTALQGLIPGKDSNASSQGESWASEAGNGNSFASSCMTSADFLLTFRGHQLKALSFFGFVAAIWVVHWNVKISEVNNAPLGMQTASPRKLSSSFATEEKHRHSFWWQFSWWQKPRTSVASCGAAVLCHSCKGAIS